ncbi:MAG: NAD(+) synthase [Treponema sp.]|jgi:NAD+ synthase|nr:NAD(+) synthase [Treponema sp.]
MRDYQKETEKRINFIRDVTQSSGARGIVYGNSGGKDSALVGILCKMAYADTLGLIMPCGSKRNYEIDKADAEAIAAQFNIAIRVIDLTPAKNELVRAISANAGLSDMALANISPRLRMAALYAVASSENRLVAGTGNRSEGYMGYFTKWGDGAHDFNPIADLTVTEIYEYLKFLGAPDFIINKAPSAGLFDGQTDEGEMGITYNRIDRFLLAGEANEHDKAVIEKYHALSEHKRKMPLIYEG